jgi:Type IV secretion system pilin
MKKFLLLSLCVISMIFFLGNEVDAFGTDSAKEVKESETEIVNTEDAEKQSIEDMERELRSLLEGKSGLQGKEKWDKDDELRKRLEETGTKGARIPFVSNGWGLLPGPDPVDVILDKEANKGSDFVTWRLGPAITNFFLMVIMILSTLMLVIGGLMYIFACGDPEIINKGRQTAIYALWGIVIAMLSYTIIHFFVNINWYGA